jgi:hypothetical protein
VLSPTKNLGAENLGPDLAVVLRAFEGGGAQRDMVLLCNALTRKGVRITVLALRAEGPLRRLLDPAIPVVEVPGLKIRYAVPGLRRLIRQLVPATIVSSEAALNLIYADFDRQPPAKASAEADLARGWEVRRLRNTMILTHRTASLIASYGACIAMPIACSRSLKARGAI